MEWPGGKRFAFSIFDDTDLETVGNGPGVYAFLTELGLRVTKSVWVLPPSGEALFDGSSCADADYLAWIRELQGAGHEIALHNVASSTSCVRRRWQGSTASASCSAATRSRSRTTSATSRRSTTASSASGRAARALQCPHARPAPRAFDGHVPGSPRFWGDLCRERVGYVRNFVYRDIDTLAACPYMPYVDPAKPYVPLVRRLGGCESRVVRARRWPPPRSSGSRRRAASRSCTRTSAPASGATARSTRPSSG